MTLVPVLETTRLRLRGHHLHDFPTSAAMWADSTVTRYLRAQPFTEEESWTRFLRYAGHWALLGFGYWLVEEKANGRFVGEVGFADYKREMQPSLAGMPEMGWVLASHAHGKGYATEAVRAASAWGDAHFVLAKSACVIAPENLASIRVASKCGYQELTCGLYRGDRVTILVRDPRPPR